MHDSTRLSRPLLLMVLCSVSQQHALGLKELAALAAMYINSAHALAQNAFTPEYNVPAHFILFPAKTALEQCLQNSTLQQEVFFAERDFMPPTVQAFAAKIMPPDQVTTTTKKLVKNLVYTRKGFSEKSRLFEEDPMAAHVMRQTMPAVLEKAVLDCQQPVSLCKRPITPQLEALQTCLERDPSLQFVWYQDDNTIIPTFIRRLIGQKLTLKTVERHAKQVITHALKEDPCMMRYVTDIDAAAEDLTKNLVTAAKRCGAFALKKRNGT